MHLLSLAVLTASLFTLVVADEIAFDSVRALPETQPTTTEYAVALKFKPQFYAHRGCWPYPAVDADGNVNEGLGPKTFVWSPRCSSIFYFTKKSQVYGRMAEYNGSWAIMYSWYFPKDAAWMPLYWGHRHGWENAVVWLDSLSENATISAVSVSGRYGSYVMDTPPSPSKINGTSLKVMYTSSFGTQHYLKTTATPGQFQDLVMWDDMPEAARSTLETTDFNNFITSTVSEFADAASVEAPMIDANFLPNLEKAFPF